MTKKADSKDVGGLGCDVSEKGYAEGYSEGFRLGYDQRGEDDKRVLEEQMLQERRQAVAQWN
jgi:hypothetical protein